MPEVINSTQYVHCNIQLSSFKHGEYFGNFENKLTNLWWWFSQVLTECNLLVANLKRRKKISRDQLLLWNKSPPHVSYSIVINHSLHFVMLAFQSRYWCWKAIFILQTIFKDFDIAAVGLILKPPTAIQKVETYEKLNFGAWKLWKRNEWLCERFVCMCICKCKFQRVILLPEHTWAYTLLYLFAWLIILQASYTP